MKGVGPSGFSGMGSPPGLEYLTQVDELLVEQRIDIAEGRYERRGAQWVLRDGLTPRAGVPHTGRRAAGGAADRYCGR